MHCVGVISCIVVGSTVRAAELASFVYAGAIVYDMTRVHACSDHASEGVARLAARAWRLRIVPRSLGPA